MPPEQPLAKEPNLRNVQHKLSSNTHRGANRSTKVAGKLKVLPEQPEVSTPTTRTSPAVGISYGGSSGTAGVSEDGDVDDDDDDDEPEEVEVSCPKYIVVDEMLFSLQRCTTRSPSYLTGLPNGMPSN
jgi:hypothetical protein